MSNNKKIDPLIFVLDRIDGEEAVLIQGENIFKINKKYLPSNTALGEKIVLTLTKESEYGRKCEKRAKDLLNEILASN
jgi:hypothetical protein